MNLNPILIVALGALGLLGVGLYGMLIVRNLIKLVAVLQILVKGALLALVAAGAFSHQMQLAQSVVMTVIVADTVVAVMGLALAVQVRKRLGTVDVTEMAELKG